MRARVLIASAYLLEIFGIQEALEVDGGFEVVGVARTGAEVLPRVKLLMPDAVLLDWRLPLLDGLGCLARLRRRYPQVKALMLADYAEEENVRAAFEQGALGYIVKSIAPTEFAAAIRQAIAGTGFEAVGPLASEDTGAASEAGLTQRELMIVKAIARGLSNAAVANELWITQQTVKFHLASVFRKLGVRNRTEAARWAFAHGYVEAALDLTAARAIA